MRKKTLERKNTKEKQKEIRRSSSKVTPKSSKSIIGFEQIKVADSKEHKEMKEEKIEEENQIAVGDQVMSSPVFKVEAKEQAINLFKISSPSNKQDP